MDRDINASINILIEGIKNLIIEKELNPSIINIGDLKNYLIDKIKQFSKVVDNKLLIDNLLITRKPLPNVRIFHSDKRGCGSSCIIIV